MRCATNDGNFLRNAGAPFIRAANPASNTGAADYLVAQFCRV